MDQSKIMSATIFGALGGIITAGELDTVTGLVVFGVSMWIGFLWATRRSALTRD
jgi:hypothetical protein